MPKLSNNEKYIMLNRREIDLRFFECFPDQTCYALAKKFDVHPSLTYQWQAGKAHVPWHRLKSLVDEQGLSWDWLIDGREPKRRKRRNSQMPRELDRRAINERFLSFFPGKSHAEIGRELGGLNPGTIGKWRLHTAQVPWERLKYAVDTLGTTWEWLLEGRE